MSFELTFLIVAALVLFSGVCSGLNIALMSLEVADLRRKAKLGNRAAARVLPLRKNSHLSLASILLANVAVVSATSLVLEHRYNGLIAGIASTLLIVILGEIFPQALFARDALAFCSRLAPVLRAMIIVTYPVSKPLQLLLDKLFGHRADRLHSRRELGIIISEHLAHQDSELDEDEVEIMRGALVLSEKRVRDIMTDIRKVYWLSEDTLVDGTKIDEIKKRGWSRIPVLNRDGTDCRGILLMKDLVDMDFDEAPVQVAELPLHVTRTVGSMTALDTMFRKFIGARSHLMPVERDDKIVGIVTIEDLIEEILGHEIEDETDRTRLQNR
jgi:CBS domain containing-hemolysin-like protein